MVRTRFLVASRLRDRKDPTLSSLNPQRFALVALMVLSGIGLFAGLAIAQPVAQPRFVPVTSPVETPEVGPTPTPMPTLEPTPQETPRSVRQLVTWQLPGIDELEAIAEHRLALGTTDDSGEHSHDSDNVGDRWAGVRQCESGGDYAITTGNGFFGAYQFTLSTWNWVAEIVDRVDLVAVRPDLAAPADQDAMAQALAFQIAGGGLGHWPVCGAYYG